MFIYSIGENNKIIKEKDGDIRFFNQDVVYLLRISDGEQSHYVYIKHISRLFNLEKYTDERKCFCPFCNHKVKGEHMDKHLACCYKLSKETGGILKMPKEGSVMQFENYKNQIKRPFMVYADCECSLIATDEAEEENGKPKCTRKTHIHKDNSCCYSFVCDYDANRNYIKEFSGDNSLI